MFTTKYRFPYSKPERFSPEEARARRLTALLEKERRFAELPNFAPVRQEVERRAALYRDTNKLLEISSQDRRRRGPKAALIAAALSRFSEKDFADPLLRKNYRALRNAQGGQQKVTPSGGDRRSFNPTGKDFASTIYGTTARLASRLMPLQHMSWKPVFRSPASVLPCIQRHERREVMFAKNHAGKGYHTKKRRTWASGVPC